MEPIRSHGDEALIRIATIGYGDIAQRRHFPEMAKLAGEVELVAIAGRSEEGLRECCRRFEIPRYYTDVDRMLSHEAIDAVLVLTPPKTHALFAAKAVSPCSPRNQMSANSGDSNTSQR